MGSRDINLAWKEMQRLELLLKRPRIQTALKHLAQLRIEIGDPLASVSPRVLKPSCAHCLEQMGFLPEEGEERGLDDGETIILYPQESNGCVRIYEPRELRVHIYETAGKAFRYNTNCSRCGMELEISAAEFIYAYPQSYHLYFDLPDTGPVKPPDWIKRRLLDWYGNRCFMCKTDINRESMSADHIVAKSNNGSLDFSNLQPLCRRCDNERKQSAKGPDYIVYLDFLLRPAPSDSYGGLIW